MRKLKLLLAVAALFGVSTAWAQTDVTNYITNADFSSTDGWTVYQSGSYRDQGNGLIGTYVVRFSAATVDETHLATENCFGFECRWSGNYASYNQTIEELPIGFYTLTFDVENVNEATTSVAYNNLFYVQVGDSKYTDESTEWMKEKSSWTTHSISFPINETATATISLGYGTGDNNLHANNTPALYVSHLKLTYKTLLEGLKEQWEKVKNNAEEIRNDEEYAIVSGSEFATLKNEIAKEEPTTVEGYKTSIEALAKATEAFKNAKTSYELFDKYNKELKYADPAKQPTINGESTAASIIKALRAYYESHALAEGVTGAVNMTNSIKNNTDPDNNNDWTWEGSKNNPASNESWTDADGTNNHKYFDGGNWNGSNWKTTMKQTISLPAGKYLLTAKSRAATNTTLKMEVGETSINLPSAGNTGNVFDRGWGDASLEFITDGNDVEIVVTAEAEPTHEWFSISDFRLMRLELYTEMAGPTDYTALEQAISTAEGKKLGFAEGEYAPYNNVDAIKALENAKAINPEEENAKDDVTKLTNTLNAATWTPNVTDVNAIYDGMFANTEANTTSGDITLPGWTKVQGIRLLVKDETVDPGITNTEGQAAVFCWGGTTITYGESNGYTLPLVKNKVYALNFKISGWRDGDLPNWVSVTLDKDVVEKSITGTGRINASEGNPYINLTFYVTPTDNNSILKIYANHHFTVADLTLVPAVAEDITIDENVSYTAEEKCANVTLKRTFSNSNWNSFVVPFNIDNTTLITKLGNVEVVEYSETSEDADNVTVKFTKMETPAIKANIPVLLKTSEAPASVVFNDVVIKTGDAKVAGTNFDFVGTYKAGESITAGDYFIKDNKLWKSAGSTTTKVTRAYIAAKSEGARITSLIIDGMETTGIMNVEQGTISLGKVYNLQGQQVKNAQKGIFIQNGKKVVIK